MKGKALFCVVGALVGLVTSVFFASKAAVEMEEVKESFDEETTDKEKVIAYVKTYSKAIISVVVSGVCILAGQHINALAITGLTGAFGAAAASSSKFDEAVADKLGFRDYRLLKKKVLDSEAVKAFNDKKTKHTGHGWVKVYEPITKQVIETDEARIYKAFYRVNQRVLKEGNCCVSDLIRWLGGKPTPTSDVLYWLDDYIEEDWEMSRNDLWVGPGDEEEFDRILAGDETALYYTVEPVVVPYTA